MKGVVLGEMSFGSMMTDDSKPSSAHESRLVVTVPALCFMLLQVHRCLSEAKDREVPNGRGRKGERFKDTLSDVTPSGIAIWVTAFLELG